MNNKTFKPMASLFLVTALISSAVSANDFQGKRFKDWGGNCETITNEQNQTSKVCYLEQVLSADNAQKPLMITAIGYGKGSKFPTLIFEVQQIADAKQGAQMKIDKYPELGMKGYCHQTACRFGATLDNPITQQLRKGTQLLFAFKASKEDQEATIFPVSLRGITQGLNELQKLR